MSDRNQLFQRLCHEAVLACGADITAVERYVFDRLADLDPPQRESVKRDIERVLGFQPPLPSARTH